MKNSTQQVQTKRTFEAFRIPKTMLQVAKETRILRANICRYVSQFRKHGKIKLVKEGTCPISKHKAAFYCTDPEYFSPEPQAELFPTNNKDSREV